MLSGQSASSLSGIPLDIEIIQKATRDDIPQLPDELASQFNEYIQRWAKHTLMELKDSIQYREIGETGQLYQSLKARFKKQLTINRIGFWFRPQGVYIEKGVGRGYNMVGGAVVRTARTRQTLRPRKPNPWFNPTIKDAIPDLEAIVAKYYDSAVINAVRIYIP